MDVRPLEAHLPFGVRLGGITRELLENASTRKEIDALFVRHGMIVFEGVEQSDEMQLALSRCFGPLKEHPLADVRRVDSERMPGVVKIGAEPADSGVVEIDGTAVSNWLPWHFDHCYNDQLNRAGVLRSVKRVEVGGLTGILDGIALYERFPRELLRRIEGKEVLYRLAAQYDQLKFGRPEQFRIIRPKPFTPKTGSKRAVHPAVWTRPSGEKVLHVSIYMADAVLGQEDPGGDALLEEVCQAINQLAKECSYHHRWRPDDMIIWDNLRMLHGVSGNPPEDGRIMYRTTIEGDYGLGRWE